MPGFAPIGGAPIGALPEDAGVDPLDVTIAETIGFADSLPGSETVDGVILESLVFVDGMFQPYDVLATSGFRLIDTMDVLRAYRITVDEALQVAPVGLVYYGLVVAERLRLVDSGLPNQIVHLLLSDVTRWQDSFGQALGVDILETVGVQLTSLEQRAIAIAEGLQLASSLTGAGVRSVSVVQALRVVDGLKLFLGAELTDTAGLGETLVTNLLASARVIDQIQVTSTLTPQFLLAVTATDAIQLDPVDVVRMLFNPALREGVEFTAGYIAPDGNFTTWVMNTRSGAVTEYDNFTFNSFARMGNRYLAASETGLYELLGNDDVGDDIVARIRSGFMQFGGTHLSRLKEAYVAMRGEGDIVLRIITAEGQVYNYTTPTRNMRSTKVHMGKGQRSRYFAFELVTAGQDFDLDTLEFVPIVVQRRV